MFRFRDTCMRIVRMHMLINIMVTDAKKKKKKTSRSNYFKVILGCGNAAFETADAIRNYAADIAVFCRSTFKSVSLTRYSGDVRGTRSINFPICPRGLIRQHPQASNSLPSHLSRPSTCVRACMRMCV